MTRSRAVVFMFIAVVLFSTSGVLVKLSTLDAISLTAGRSIVAGVVFWAWLRRPHFTWSGPQISGAFAFIGATVFFVAATQSTTAANAVLLQFTAPVYVAVIGIWFLGERASRVDWLTIGLSALGMALFFSGDLSTQGFLGNIYAILSGVSLAWLVLALRKQKDGSSLETVLLGSIIAAVAGLPFLLRAQPTSLDLGILVFLGIFSVTLSKLLMVPSGSFNMKRACGFTMEVSRMYSQTEAFPLLYFPSSVISTLVPWSFSSQSMTSIFLMSGWFFLVSRISSTS